MRQVKLKVFVVYHDNGDGSSTSRLYNSIKSAMNDANKNKNMYPEHDEFETEDDFLEWLDDDPYERGSYGWDTISLIVHDESVVLDEYGSNRIYSHNQ